MSRLPFAPLLALAISFSAHAESPSALASSSAASPASPTPSPDRPHAVSSQTSARVVDSLPKFAPRAVPSENSATASADLREIDKPRNTILRLPKALVSPALGTTGVSVNLHADEPPPDGVLRLPQYEVHDRKYPALKNRELLTPEAKIDLQFKRHPGLHFGNLFGLNRGIAAAMAEEDDARERGLEMADLFRVQYLAETNPPKESDADDSSADFKPGATPAPAVISK